METQRSVPVARQIHGLPSGLSRKGHDDGTNLGRAKCWSGIDTSKQQAFVRSVVRQVVIGKMAIWIEVDRARLAESLLGHNPEYVVNGDDHGHDTINLTADFQALCRGNELCLAEPNGPCYSGTAIPSLVKAIALARGWYEQIISGEISTVTELGEETGLQQTYVKRILQCATLSPQITEAFLSGKQRANLTLQTLLDNISTDWREQSVTIPLS
jgi:site-specific DNA recombinase